MKYVVDTHTHSIVSGHAYTTLMENIKEASKNGIKVLGATEHGPNMPGGPHLFYFGNISAIPRKIYDVIILRGCEANIIDYNGELDIPIYIQENLDLIIASFHEVTIKPGNIDQNTKSLLNVMENSNVDIIGHSGNPAFPIWKEDVVKAAKKYDKIIEVNNSSSKTRMGSEENCIEIVKLCNKHNVKVVIGSDAHFCFDIGKFDKANKIIENANIQEELIMNTDETKIIKYLQNKNKIKDLILD